MEFFGKEIKIKSIIKFNLCRLCFQSDTLLFPIKAKRRNFEILEILKKITDKEISDSFDSPDKICSECLRKIDSVIDLIELCKKSEESLQAMKPPNLHSISDLLKDRPLSSYDPQNDIPAPSSKADSDNENDSDDYFFKEPEVVKKRRDKKIDFSKINVDKIVETGVLVKPKGKQKLICSTCGKICLSSTILIDHEYSHTGRKPYTCDICGSTLSNKGNIYEHMRRIHLNKRTKFNCEYCGRTFDKKYTFKEHVNTHTKAIIYKCPQCPKTFLRKILLGCHVRLHSGYRPFKCPYCERDFTQQIDMKRHSYSHTGERPYKCNFSGCDKGFIKRSCLTSHEKTHNYK